MNPEIVVAPDASPDLKEAVKLAQCLVLASASDVSRKGYAADFAHFNRWASTHGLNSLPASPETVTLYVAAMSIDYALPTILRRLTSIGYPLKFASDNGPFLSRKIHRLTTSK